MKNTHSMDAPAAVGLGHEMTTRKIFRCTEEDVASCASVIKVGGVIVYPTDTVYGIGCDPYNDLAVKRIFTIKGRNENKSLPILASNIMDAERIVSLGRIGRLLAERYWPGALTIVAPLIDHRISQGVRAGSSGLAVRVPANNCVLSLLCRWHISCRHERKPISRKDYEKRAGSA